jgi:hypothetical protein
MIIKLLSLYYYHDNEVITCVSGCISYWYGYGKLPSAGLTMRTVRQRVEIAAVGGFMKGCRGTRIPKGDLDGRNVRPGPGIIAVMHIMQIICIILIIYILHNIFELAHEDSSHSFGEIKLQTIQICLNASTCKKRNKTAVPVDCGTAPRITVAALCNLYPINNFHFWPGPRET